MGQCGCADTLPDFQFPGPDGVVYALQIYPSCHYCITPAGVELYRFDTNDEDTDDWLAGVPTMPFMAYDDTDPVNAQALVPVLDAKDMAMALNEVDEDGRSHSESDIRCAMPDAVWRTLNAWRSEENT